MPNWLDVFPVGEQLCGNIEAESVFLVDIGGGPGHQCGALKERYPDMRGRIILQDTEDIMKEALFCPGVEAMVHDFWTEQPVKGISSRSSLRTKDWFVKTEGNILNVIQGPAHTTYGTSCMTGLTGNAFRSFRTSSQP